MNEIRPTREQVAQWHTEACNAWPIFGQAWGFTEYTTMHVAYMTAAMVLEQAALMCDALGMNDGVTCAEELRSLIPTQRQGAQEEQK